MKLYIYGLSDPRDKRILYIGQTNSPIRRLSQYTNSSGNCKNGNGPLTIWLLFLNVNGLSPEMTIIETIDNPHEGRNYDEDYIVRNQPLLNRTGVKRSTRAMADEFATELLCKIRATL